MSNPNQVFVTDSTLDQLVVQFNSMRPQTRLYLLRELFNVAHSTRDVYHLGLKHSRNRNMKALLYRGLIRTATVGDPSNKAYVATAKGVHILNKFWESEKQTNPLFENYQRWVWKSHEQSA